MKILKNNYNEMVNKNIKQVKHYPRKLICEECRSELEYEKSDLRIGEFGCLYLDCPCCGRDNIIDDEDGITLTANNIEFPTHFFHTLAEEGNGVVDRCNTDEIRIEIKRAISYFRKNKDEFHWCSWSGNLYVSVNRYSGDNSYDVTVSNDFYSVDIPFEEEDY